MRQNYWMQKSSQMALKWPLEEMPSLRKQHPLEYSPKPTQCSKGNPGLLHRPVQKKQCNNKIESMIYFFQEARVLRISPEEAIAIVAPLTPKEVEHFIKSKYADKSDGITGVNIRHYIFLRTLIPNLPLKQSTIYLTKVSSPPVKYRLQLC